MELTWDELIAALNKLDGTTGVDGKLYMPGELPAGFTTADDTHTIWWEWKFTGGSATYDVNGDGSLVLDQDEYDTYMGNMDEMDDVSLKITITATQED